MKGIVTAIFFCLVIFMTITSAQEYTIEVIQNAVGIESAFATGINNNGVVVGTCWKPNFGLRAFKYENGMMSVIIFPAALTTTPYQLVIMITM